MQLKFLFLPIFLFLLISLDSIFGQESCFNGLFKSHSTYDLNRRLILSSLDSNVTANDGFYSSSIGKNSSRVFVIGMCIPGTEPEYCAKCIKGGSEKLLESCHNQTNAYTWPDCCMVQYSNTSFSGSLVMEPTQVFQLGSDNYENSLDFERIWGELMLRTIAAASNGTSSLPQKYYAAEVASLTKIQTMYAMMQCTPDISPGDCKYCLEKNVDDYGPCCHGTMGGAVVRPRCFIRWELYSFARAFENVTSPSPPQQSLPPTPLSLTPLVRNKENTTAKVAVIVVPIIVILVLLGFGFAIWRRRKSSESYEVQVGDQITRANPLQFNYQSIEAATSMFSDSNLIGQGGFGEVYKGTLSTGTEVAVKRLSETSRQGAQEFKNEAVLVGKLQHKNLVRLLGFCLKGQEKVLVYEFVPNKSLDDFLFDPDKKRKLDWTRRYNIIGGIARGILYLHQDSRLTIIHRDLKAANILLDADMNPKIADFGLARIFGVDESQANTKRVVGTHGYMSPEYAMQGHFSMKSDVYSFGVMILEIISGKSNSSFYHIDGSPYNLVTHAWKLWRNGSPLELMDPTVQKSYQTDEAIRCIHIALLCVQENPADRPSSTAIILMLTSSTTTLPLPRAPGFYLPSSNDAASQSKTRSLPISINDITITDLDPR